MIGLRDLLATAGLSQAALAREVGLNSTVISRLCRGQPLPRFRQPAVLLESIKGALARHGVEAVAIDAALIHAMERREAPDQGNDVAAPAADNNSVTEDLKMLLRKQPLLPATKKVFQLFRDPFDELQSADELWLSPDIRYVREALLQTARHGGFLAVVGESGSGKSTLRRDLNSRLAAENQPVIVIEPYVLGSEDNDRTGKTLKSSHLAEAILGTVSPLEKPRQSPQARFAQLHRVLKESHAAGYRHCLLIEEAHSLPVPTLKHLKRLLELEAGFTRLLSIVLIGQPELGLKLSERNAEVREVVQRCEVVSLPPIEEQRLGDFLDFRLERAGKKLADVFAPDALPAIAARLCQPGRRGGEPGVSLLYPLAIANLVTAALNLASSLGVERVTADVVRGL